MKRNGGDKQIFFPWERRGGLLRRLGLHRLRPFVLASIGLAFVILLALRERHDAGVRRSRTTLMGYRHAVDSYMAQHGGKCPPSLDVLSNYGEFRAGPRDAWGRPLRFVCPVKDEAAGYMLSSDGPDGEPGGLDRIY